MARIHMTGVLPAALAVTTTCAQAAFIGDDFTNPPSPGGNVSGSCERDTCEVDLKQFLQMGQINFDVTFEHLRASEALFIDELVVTNNTSETWTDFHIVVGESPAGSPANYAFTGTPSIRLNNDPSFISNLVVDGILTETLSYSFDFTNPISPGDSFSLFAEFDIEANVGTIYTLRISQVPTVPALVVPLDIRPGSCPNPLNCKAQGVLPVAIAGTVDLDVTQIDPLSVRLAGVAPLRSDIEDVTTPFEPFTGKQDCDIDCNTVSPDGFPDLTLKFDLQEVIAALGNAVQDGACLVVELTGNLREEAGGTAIVGEDVMRILCKRGKK